MALRFEGNPESNFLTLYTGNNPAFHGCNLEGHRLIVPIRCFDYAGVPFFFQPSQTFGVLLAQVADPLPG
ncbi:hypothetical protein D3C80_1888170 [compost metagenome]